MADAFPTTRAYVEREIEDGLFSRGAQLHVMVDGETALDYALGSAGLGNDVTTDTVFRVYCSIKPVTTLAIAHLVDAGELDLDAPLHERLPGFQVLERGDVTLRHVLTHTAGLQYPSAVSMELMPSDERRSFLERYRGEPGWRVGVDAAYSEYFGWHLLGFLIEAVTGEPLREHLRDRVLDPLGLHDTFVGMTASEYNANLERLGVNYDLHGGWQAYPMLIERTERFCCETNCAYGGYTTARELARLYAALLAQQLHSSVPAMPSADTITRFCSNARPRGYDAILQRECDFGLGFMTNLFDHRFGTECSPASFGHSGNVGSSFAFADPELELAVGVIFNGIVDQDSAFLRRPALVHAIYTDLEARRELSTAPPSEEPDEAHPPERRRRWRSRR
jgi:CubicO group peptidase (beta-lactamase class C family)